jgi:hypothetical protein
MWDRGAELSHPKHDNGSVLPTGQKSKKCPQVEGHVVRLSARHAKIRPEGYRMNGGG